MSGAASRVWIVLCIVLVFVSGLSIGIAGTALIGPHMWAASGRGPLRPGVSGERRFLAAERILDRLESLGLAGDTLVVFTSDHGHLFGQHGLTAKGPFHYEDLVRVPLIVAQPGRVPAGRRARALQSLVDFAPSFLSAAGLLVPGSMTGVDQTNVWYGEQDRLRDHVLVENRHEPTTIHLRTFINERYKLTVYYNRDYGELFDLADDPHEVRNLWNVPAARELKNDLIGKLLHAELGREPLPMPRIAGA